MLGNTVVCQTPAGRRAGVVVDAERADGLIEVLTWAPGGGSTSAVLATPAELELPDGDPWAPVPAELTPVPTGEE